MNIPTPLSIIENYIAKNDVLKDIVETMCKEMSKSDKFPIDAFYFTANTTERLSRYGVEAIDELFRAHGWRVSYHYKYIEEDKYYANHFIVRQIIRPNQ